MTSRAKYPLGILLLATLYLVTGTLGFTLRAIGGTATLLWAPSAIGLAVCLVYGIRWWPGILLGTFLVLVVRGVGPGAALLVGIVDVAEVYLGCFILLGVLDFRRELDRVRDVIALVEVSFAISLLSATATVSTLFALGVVDESRVTQLWSGWWWSHFSGDLIVAPAILTCARRWRIRQMKPTPSPAEAVVLTLTVMVVVLLVLGRWLPEWLPASNAPYYLLPLMLWAGVRFGPRGAALASLGASVIAIIAQSFGLGPFSRLFDLQAFVAISTISTLMISALAIERVKMVERKGALQTAALDAIISIDRRGHVLELNPAAERMFAIRAADAIGRDLATLVIPPRFRDAFHRGIRNYLRNTSAPLASRYRVVGWRADDNSEFPVEVAITSVPVEDEIVITGFIRDLSAEQAAENALRNAHDLLERKVEERTRELVAANLELERRDTLMRQAEELAHLGSFDFDLKTKKLKWSDELYRIYGRDLASFEPSYDAFLAALHARDRLTHDKPLGFEETIRRPDGSQRILQTLARVFVDENATPVRLAGCSQDITERKRNEAVRTRLAQLVESSDDAMIGMTPAGIIETWNTGATKLFGYSASEVVGSSCKKLVSDEFHAEVDDLIARLSNGERVSPYEMPHVRRDGTVFEAAVTTSPAVDSAGHVVGISKVMRDITNQKNIENQIRASLREKDVLLREIHHRVKNNLQVIASLLNLQVSAERSDAARKSLIESQSRIQSMALVHQLLYLSKDLSDIDAGEYLTKLTRRLVETYNIVPDRIAVQVRSQPMRLDIDRAIPCGLILNELLTNALTHAFPDQRTGQIWITIERSQGNVVLTVADDGVGIPADLHIAKAKTFGLRIAHTLAMQLDGTISLTREHGTAVRVVFPISART